MGNYVTFPIHKEGQTGMSTTSESLTPYPREASAQDVAWDLSSYETDELFLQGITALRQGIQAAYKVRAREDYLRFPQGVHTTPDPDRASQYTRRLMPYCVLIGSLAMELSSIAQPNPATDAEGSSLVPESSQSSLPTESNPSPSDDFEWMIGLPEPRFGSIVQDAQGDAWQHRYDGWYCTVGDEYQEWTWSRLTNEYKLRILVRNES